MELRSHFLVLFFVCSALATNTDVKLCRYFESRREMDCSNRNLGKVKAKQFPLNKSETTTVNLRNTKLKELPFDAFFCLSNLEYLDLATNLLQELDERIFSYVKSMVQLELSHNRLTHLPGSLFQNLTELRKVYLNSNKITFLKDGNTFISQGKLHFLSLKDNRITTVTGEVLKPLSSLNVLDLSGNPLSCDCDLRISMLWCRQKCLNTHAVCQLPSEYNGQPWTELDGMNCSYSENRLSILGIKSNTEITSQCREKKCYYDSKDTSMDCENVILDEVNADQYPLDNVKLRSVNLRNTRLRKIGSNSFNKLTELYEIDMGGNLLETIESGVFSKLRNLRMLYLDSNKLVSLNDKAIFASQSSLEVLSLSYNKLSFISADVLTPLISLNSLSLQENLFICDCSLRPAVVWCDNKNLLTRATCNSPKEFAGVSWDILRNTIGECAVKETDITLIIIAFLIGISLASCFIIAIWLLWKRKRLDGTTNSTVLTYDDVKQQDYYYETIAEAEEGAIPTVPPNLPSRPPNLTKETDKLTGRGDSRQIYDDVQSCFHSGGSTSYIFPNSPVNKSFEENTVK